MVRRILLFVGRMLRDFGRAQYSFPPPEYDPDFTTSPGHPEEVVPLAKLPEDERRWWIDLEKNLW